MNISTLLGAAGIYTPRLLLEDGERLLLRAARSTSMGARSVLVLAPSTDHSSVIDQLNHEYSLKDELDPVWAARPVEILRESGQAVLVLEDLGGQPLEQLLETPMEIEALLRLGIGIATALRGLHQSGFIHKDLKPANILVDPVSNEIRFTGFGLTSRLPRERQSPDPPETIAGTLAYMAPEQTGRMNRSIDSRSDLYAFGVILYRMLTGALPFTAADPMEWVHCHIARRPFEPVERRAGTPAMVSAIIMKLLAKTAEDRYQTASAAGRDLARCLVEWELAGQVAPFGLADRDVSDRMTIPERLYGRSSDMAELTAAVDRIANGGATELLLVSGYSGIGKSSIVNELQRTLIASHAIFATGKADQYKRNIPYSTFVQAFQSLIRSLLVKSDAALARWREALLEALGSNGQLIADLVPDLKFIIGDLAPPPELPPPQAQSRFQLVVQRFIGLFAQADHPLIIFLDDLQWIDAATLDLIETLLAGPSARHLLLIGAYRDNEVDAAHPLARKLAVVRESGAVVHEITLAPLSPEDIALLIDDSLRCGLESAEPLAYLMHEKTGGNPFFAIQFLSSLVEEGLLIFDQRHARWSWDIGRIENKSHTENVIDLLVEKLNRLPAEAQQAMRALACMGSGAPLALLEGVTRQSSDEVHADLWQATHAGFVFRADDSYRFLHDRIQQAAYSLISEEDRVEMHFQIGKVLSNQASLEKRGEAIFEIVNQLNQAIALVVSQEDRQELAVMNLIAGRRAKASSAFASALTYFGVAATLLPEGAWAQQQELLFALEIDRADCEFATGAVSSADERLTALVARAQGTMQRADVASRRTILYTMMGDGDRGLAVGLEYLLHAGIDWSAKTTKAEADQEYAQIWVNLGQREIEDLIDLPPMRNAEALATISVLTAFATTTLYTDKHLYVRTIGRVINLGLIHGTCPEVFVNFVGIGLIAAYRFADYDAAYRLARLGCQLADAHGVDLMGGKAYMVFALVVPYKRPMRESIAPARLAFQKTSENGDPVFAAYAWRSLVGTFLASGEPLDRVRLEATQALDFSRRAQFGFMSDMLEYHEAFVLMLRGESKRFGLLDHDHFTEESFEKRLTGIEVFALSECYYWATKLQARFFSGDYASALEASSKAAELYTISETPRILLLEWVQYHFFSALARTALVEPMEAESYTEHREALAGHEAQLREWASSCPENFENCGALVSGEIARIEGRDLDAQRYYETAIKSARKSEFVNHEALANEIAARFYLDRGFETIARAYLQEAKSCYRRWGADGKIGQLESLYPFLREPDITNVLSATFKTPVESLDLATVIKASQAASGKTGVDGVIEVLMHLAMEHAGAQRGVLVLVREDKLWLEVEAIADRDGVSMRRSDGSLGYPASVVQYVMRTREVVVLENASTHPTYSSDAYLLEHKARSVLCLPLVNGSKLVGVLYFENNLATQVFIPSRIAVLRLLALQAATSLESAYLYEDIAERESKIRRLVDANIIGIVISDLTGQVIECNEAFLQMIDYQQADLKSGILQSATLTPPEWRAADEQAASDLKSTGIVRPYEKEVLRRDGRRVPVLVGGAMFDGSRDRGVGFVLDLTDRKQAEAQARESERRFGEVQAELAHANRVATMGQLTASIAHEVNQPMAAMIGNAEAAMRWLARQPPDPGEVGRLLANIVRDGRRAANVINGIRDLTKKAPPRMEKVEINGAIREVLELTRGEVVKGGILMRTQFMDGLPPVIADRTQLQQVILNLVVNAVQALSESDSFQREVLVETSAYEDGTVRVSVKDTGPGIASDGLGRLFDPFYSTKPSGMGMGLSICRSIVESHQGRMWVTKNAPRGAAFHFTIGVGEP